MAVFFYKPLLRSLSLGVQQKNSLFLSPSLKALIHDEERRYFILKMPNGVAHITYKKLNGVIDLDHTYVPEKFRGSGVAATLAKEVLDYCLKNRINVKLSCSYLQRYYDAHYTHYQSIVI